MQPVLAHIQYQTTPYMVWVFGTEKMILDLFSGAENIMFGQSQVPNGVKTFWMAKLHIVMHLYIQRLALTTGMMLIGLKVVRM